MTSARAHNTNRPAVVRPGKDGYILVGGGIINHYRHWNAKAGFGEAYPKGNSWSCKVGFGNGDFTCQALSYKLPPGTRCINRKASSNNAGVVHAALPLGYTMVSGGVQNLYRRWNKLSAFEDSMPSGNRWRCDTGFGSGKLNCFVRGCKFPHGGKCITRRGYSNHAGWVWASCPRGYRVFGCGMMNHYRHFGPRSGFEDLRPIGNKCMGDMGFGAGRISVYARCCKITGPSATIKATKRKPPGKVKSGRKVCIGGAKWEMRSGFYCPNGNIANMAVVPWGRRGAPAKRNMCAFSCARRGNCKAFAFPTRGSRCMMKNTAGMQSGVLRKKCSGGKSNS